MGQSDGSLAGHPMFENRHIRFNSQKERMQLMSKGSFNAGRGCFTMSGVSKLWRMPGHGEHGWQRPAHGRRVPSRSLGSVKDEAVYLGAHEHGGI